MKNRIEVEVRRMKEWKNKIVEVHLSEGKKEGEKKSYKTGQN